MFFIVSTSCKGTESGTRKKPQKKVEDYQSSFFRHLVQNDACILAYTDHSFGVVCACLSKSGLDVMEAL